jgi:hypothetical protein
MLRITCAAAKHAPINPSRSLDAGNLIGRKRTRQVHTSACIPVLQNCISSCARYHSVARIGGILVMQILTLSEMPCGLPYEFSRFMHTNPIALRVPYSLTNGAVERKTSVAIFGWHAELVDRLLFRVWKGRHVC